MNQFTEEELELVRTQYIILGAKELSSRLGRSISSIKVLARKLKATRSASIKICKIDQCDSIVNAHGLCDKHLKQALNNGELNFPKCSVLDCDRFSINKKLCLCNKHLSAYRRKQHPDKDKQYSKKSREKNKDRNIEACREWYSKNKERVCKEKRDARLLNNIEYLHNKTEYLKKLTFALNLYNNKCAICKSKDMVTFEFHHKFSSDEVTSQVIRRIYKAKQIDPNIMLLCSNCHIHMNLNHGTALKGLSNLKVFSYDYLPKDSREKRLFKLKYKAFQIYGCACQNCGNSDPATFAWHHRIRLRPKETQGAVLKHIVDNNAILEHILLLCSNCHIKQDIIDGTNKKGKLLLEVSLNASLY